MTSADQVCAAGANPCKVTGTVVVDDGAVLDFGTRALEVTGSGRFDFGIGSGSILAGPVTISTTGTAITARGTAPGGGSESGTVRIEARRRCSAGTSPPACIDGNDCQLGTCGVRRCTLRPSRTCTSDASCDLGACVSRRCNGTTAVVRCSTNADCQYGTCPQQLTCSNRAVDPLACAVDADCDFGACSVGTASLALGGAVAGNSGDPATLLLRAADSIAISKAVNLAGSTSQSDGGGIVAYAGHGSISVTARITATGGGLSQGGTVELVAAGDVTLAEEISVVGGDFDGGAIDVSAGRDLAVARSLLANAASGAGFGGEILLEAGRDLSVSGASSSNRTVLETNGSTDATNTAGDGGSQELVSARNLSLLAFTRLASRGSTPDGSGGEVVVASDGDLAMEGDITAKADGAEGSGGGIEVSSGAFANIGASATFDASGGGGGGALDIDGGAGLAFAGSAVVSGGNSPGGTVVLDADGDAQVSGILTVAGLGGGDLEASACRLVLAGTAKLDNKVATGTNTLVARESMRLLAGSSVKTGGGPNRLVYRTSAKPPLLAGTVTPAPTLVVDPTLEGCPVCGNGEVDQGETCDDGNLAGGDGCSSLCQNEKCLAQTIAPGYPQVALCEDGDPCTDDFCNTTQNGGTCRHPKRNCDDGIACTADSCAGGACVHAANDDLCDDGNECSTDVCTTASGCVHPAASGPCDDGDACTTSDECVASQCVGIPVQDCAVCGDGAVQPGEQCDDGNATFAIGEYCAEGCVAVPCGRPTNGGGSLPRSSDALHALRSAVGLATCSPRVCDVDKSGGVLAGDALRILRAAVGQAVTLNCPEA